MASDTLTMKNIQDASVYDFKGDRTRVKRYTFYLGTHGPFVEEVPLDPTFDEQEIGRRIQALKTHLMLVTS